MDARQFRETKRPLLRQEAQRISHEHFGGAPVAIIVGGRPNTPVPIMVTGWWLGEGPHQYNELIGLLQAAIQVEAIDHYAPILYPDVDLDNLS